MLEVFYLLRWKVALFKNNDDAVFGAFSRRPQMAFESVRRRVARSSEMSVKGFKAEGQ
jgi:hypothetical protein|tara:strand:- start:636 stop:809 length:174 start_codon:yes stop_codon:yes gene_type:complete